MKVKLWTIQDESGWVELQTKGILTAKKEFIEPYFKSGYDWMKIQMIDRIGIPADRNQYPIWAWYQLKNANTKRPDLRESGYFPTGTIGYRIEIEKEEKDILLSDFELWHTPLSYKRFIANSENELIEFESELKRKFNTTHYELLPTNIKKKIESSWTKIFDLDFEVEYFVSPLFEKQIQATFWELKLNEIVYVDKFIAR